MLLKTCPLCGSMRVKERGAVQTKSQFGVLTGVEYHCCQCHYHWSEFVTSGSTVHSCPHLDLSIDKQDMAWTEQFQEGKSGETDG